MRQSETPPNRVSPSAEDGRTYEIVWEGAPQPRRQPSAAAVLNTPSAVSAALAEDYERLARRFDLEQFIAGTSSLDEVARHYAADALKQLGISGHAGGEVWVTLAERSDRNANLLERLGHAAAGVSGKLGSARKQAANCPHVAAELELLDRTGKSVPRVLKGEINALEALFPGGDSSLVERIYRQSPAAKAYNQLISHSLRRLVGDVDPGAALRVLEIGAGTGSTTRAAMEALPADRTHYCFTDVSEVFLDQARSVFGDETGIRYELLNLETDPLSQGFAAGEFDIVIAANVVHATADIRRSLTHMKQLLAPGGVLLLLETTGTQPWIDLTFGITDGWWRVSDTDLRPDSPMLTRSAWIEALAEAGFEDGIAVPNHDDNDEKTLKQAVILARSQPANDAQANTDSGCWILVDGGDEKSAEIAQALTRLGQDCCLLSDSATTSAVDDEAIAQFFGDVLERSGKPIVGVIHTLGLSLAGGAGDLEDVEEGTRCLVMSALAALREIVTREMAHTKLWIVTENAQAVRPGDAVTGVLQSVLWGLGRSAAAEHPGHWGGLIDVADVDDAVANKVSTEILSPDGETQVALRGSDRFVPRLRRLPRNASADFRPRSDSTYLVTGGLGGIGLRIARHLVDKGARYLALASRSDPNPDQAAVIAELRDQGASVAVFSVDVSEKHEVTALLEKIATSLPPLRGLVHSAGVFDDRVIVHQDWGRFRRVLAPKVYGAWNLHQTTADLNLDLFALFSSGASVLSAPGLSNYAAANAFLDSLAHHRHSEDLCGTSFNWGPWSATGMASAVGEGRETQWDDSGFKQMSPADCLHAFDQGIAGAMPQIGVFDVDWSTFSSQWSGRGQLAFLREVMETDRDRATVPEIEQPNSLPALYRAMDAEGDERVAIVSFQVAKESAQVLRLGSGIELDQDRALVDSGLDSLMAVELRNRIESEFDVAISVGRILDGASVRELVAVIVDSIGTGLPTGARPVAGGAEDTSVSVDDMSDSEVEAMLNRLLEEKAE